MSSEGEQLNSPEIPEVHMQQQPLPNQSLNLVLVSQQQNNVHSDDGDSDEEEVIGMEVVDPAAVAQEQADSMKATAMMLETDRQLILLEQQETRETSAVRRWASEKKLTLYTCQRCWTNTWLTTFLDQGRVNPTRLYPNGFEERRSCHSIVCQKAKLSRDKWVESQQVTGPSVYHGKPFVLPVLYREASRTGANVPSNGAGAAVGRPSRLYVSNQMGGLPRQITDGAALSIAYGPHIGFSAETNLRLGDLPTLVDASEAGHYWETVHAVRARIQATKESVDAGMDPVHCLLIFLSDLSQVTDDMDTRSFLRQVYQTFSLYNIIGIHLNIC